MRPQLSDLLHAEGAECARVGSLLYGELLARAADDLERGGVVAEVLLGCAERPRLGPVALRLMAAVHRLVLDGRAPALARYFPSVGGTSSPAHAWPAMRRTLEECRREVRALLERPLQTNEVGRSAALLGGLLVALDRAARLGGRRYPARLLEAGASAGLNLRVDRFAFDVGGALLGDPASPVRLVEPWVGTPLDVSGAARLLIVERRGCDLVPLDPTSPEDRLTLASYVFGDQLERLERLRAALAVTARVPAVVERAGAGPWLERVLAHPAEGHLTVVWHSATWQYLQHAERSRAEAALAASGARATEAAPLARLALERRESRRNDHVFEVRLTMWPGGTEQTLADAEGHGPPIRWRPAGSRA
ncbi:MAG TPA: DUF2332 domain-containing protein [Actinomycetes bacterium]|nr:DUF2332 domain-containing protein [Actinomycetes bacterium]